MKTLDAPAALAALMEGKILQGSNCDSGARFLRAPGKGFVIAHTWPKGTTHPLLVESLCNFAPFTIIDEAKEELPESVKSAALNGDGYDGKLLLAQSILKAVDERIAAALKEHEKQFWHYEGRR